MDMKGSKKGVLFTLLMIIIFILMLAELITYVITNESISQAEEITAQTLNGATFVKSINQTMYVCLSSLLSQAINVLTNYEYNSSLRNSNFLNNTAQSLAQLISTGTLFGNTLMQASLSSCINAINKSAASHQVRLQIANMSLAIYQSSAFNINLLYTMSAIASTSTGTYIYPISINVSYPLQNMPDLALAEGASYYPIILQTALPSARIIANAIAGSRSPFMLRYGRIFLVAGSGSPTCSSLPSKFENGNYILAAQSASSINQNICGFGGLITNVTNSSIPLKPYLVLPSSYFSSGIQNGTYALIDGPALSLLNISGATAAVNASYAYASQYTPSYLERASGNFNIESPNGMFLMGFGRRAANFSGGAYIQTPQLKQMAGVSSASITAWVYLNSLSSNNIIFSDDWGSPEILQFYIHTNGQLEADFGNGGWIVAALTPAFTIQPNKWYFVFATWSSGKGISIYVNGVSEPLSYIVGSKTSTGTLAAGTTGNIASNQGNGGVLNGMLANLQIYNTSLTQMQQETLYLAGINGHPISYTKNLVAWYPLNGNANDYSGNGNNGVQSSSVIYSPLYNYQADPIMQGSIYEFNAQPMCGFSCNDYQCKGTNLYLGNETLMPGKVASFSSNSVCVNNGYVPIQTPRIAISTAKALTITWWVKPIGPTSVLLHLNSGNACPGGSGIYCGNNYCNIPDTTVTGISSATAGTWSFWSLILASNGTAVLYKNGVPGTSVSWSGPLTSISDFDILGYEPTCSDWSNASMANVQIYNTSLSAKQIKSMYSAGIGAQPINQSYLVAWYPLNGNFYDYSPYNNNCKTYGAFFVNNSNVSTSAMQALGLTKASFPGFATFNGSGYIKASASNLPSGSGSRSMSMWVKVNKYQAQESTFAYYGQAGTNNNTFTLYTSAISSPANVLCFSQWGSALCGKTVLTPGRWYFVAVSDSSNTISLYVNGNLENSGTLSISTPASSNFYMGMTPGYSSSSYTRALNGSLADIQVYNTALSQAQIWQLYVNNSVIGLLPIAYWPLNGGLNGMFNVTQNMVSGNNGVLYVNSTGSMCRSNDVTNGRCAVEYSKI
ncbi:MAG: LamG domain-containing protein [Candidatus Micrarchaeaceae archaeon]